MFMFGRSIIMGWLKGKKTVLGSVAAGAPVIAHSLNLLDSQTAEIIAGVIVAWTGVSLRPALKNK